MKKLLPALLVVCCILHSAKSFSQLVINEICPSNTSTIIGPSGEYDDWIELYNASSSSIDLTDYGLSDQSSSPFKFRFSSGAIPSHGRVLIFPNDNKFTHEINHWEMSVSADDDWRYFVGNSQPDTNWRNPSFNDHNWLLNQGGFGYGDGDDETIIPVCYSVSIRRHFNVTDPSRVLKAILAMDYDDGFIAYLNGVEIARANLGSPGSRPPYNELTPLSHEALDYQGDDVEIFLISEKVLRSNLRAGDNVLAIEVHNKDAGNNDLTSNANLFFAVNSGTYVDRHVPSGFSMPDVDPYEAPFKLGSTGETITLSDNSGSIIDQKTFTDLQPDHSYARSSDGASTWCYYSSPTPGAANNSACYAGYCTPPVFSMPAGFYPASFTLYATTTQSGGTVRYTTNGGDPKTSSSNFSGGYVIGSTKNIKARVYASGYLPSPVVSNSYFINERTHLPVFTITTPPENLWNYYSGIYVFGPNADSLNSPYFGSNFWQDWERPATIEYYDKDKNRLFNFGADIAMYGNYTRAKPQKTFEIKMKQSYGLGSINYPLISDKPFIQEFDNFILRNAGQDWNEMHCRDAVLERIMKPTYSGYIAAEPAIMYLNGEYWGLYSVGENHDASFIKNNYGYDEDHIDYLLENGSITTKKGSASDFYSLVTYATTQNPSTNSYYNYINSRLDLENFTDYIIAETYFDNQDWMGAWTNNIKIWRPEGGKWKYILYDLDLTSGQDGASVSRNTLEICRNPANQNYTSDLFDAILNNPKYKNYFVNRYADLINTIFQDDSVEQVLEQYTDSMAYDMTKHCTRWGYNMSSWHNEIDDFEDYFEDRISPVRGFIQNGFGLTSQVNVTLKVSPAGAGRIHINSIDPKVFPWQGVYFNGVPVTITAIPNPGYSFDHWRSNVAIPTNDGNQTVTKNFTSADIVTAYFTGSSSAPEIVVSELNYNSDSAFNAGDWIELHNAIPDDLDISGWVIKDDNDFHQYIFPVPTIIESGEYLVVAEDMTLFDDRFPMISNVTGPLGYNLNNFNDQIRLFNFSGNLILNMNYSDQAPWPETADGDGYTCELRSVSGNLSDGNNWFAGCYGGSPGNPFSSPDPNVSAASGTLICSGGSTELEVADHSNWSYQWQNQAVNIPGETSAEFTATASGSYSCIITGLGCTINSHAVTVSILPVPNDPVVASSFTCGPGSVGLQYSSADTIYWFTSMTGNPVHQGNTFTTPVISSTRTYYVRANDFCPSDFVPVQAEVKTVSAPPVVQNATACEGASVTLHATSADPVQWYNVANGGVPVGTGLFYLTSALHSPAIFYVSAGDDCPSARIPVNVSIDSPPEINLGNDIMVSSGTLVPLDAGPGFSSYIWSDLSTTQSISVTAPSVVWVLATDSAGCTDTDSISITIQTGIDGVAGTDQFSLYPNPVSGTLHYSLNQKSNENIIIRVIDLNGRIMNEHKISSSGIINGEFDVANYASGVYIVSVITTKEQKQIMITVE